MKKIILLVVLTSFSPGLSAAYAAGFSDLGPYFSFQYGDGGGIPADVNNTTGQITSADGQSVKLYGDLGPIDGARFKNGFVLSWFGSYDAPINPGDTFTADLTFSAHATGGSLAWDFLGQMYGGPETVQILTDPASMPQSGDVTGAHLESPMFTQQSGGSIFAGYLHIDWTGYSPTDTLTVSIPQNSVDLTFTPAPEPGTLTLWLTAFLLIYFWRRSRRSFADSRA